MTEERYVELKLDAYQHKLNLFERIGIRLHNVMLLCKYPFLRCGGGTWFTYLDSMPNGWRLAFGMDMCKELKEAIKREKRWGYEVFEVKEKFGTLRWYDNASEEGPILDVVDKYEAISRTTCVTCGKYAKWMSLGWILPFCEECKDKEIEMNPTRRFKEF